MIFTATYVGWLVAFERAIEPWLRRGAGALLRCSIVWVPAGGPFWVWGLPEPRRPKLEASVALLGSTAVLLAAMLPIVAPALFGYLPDDGAATAASYLLSVPMMAFFAFRVLARGADAVP